MIKVTLFFIGILLSCSVSASDIEDIKLTLNQFLHANGTLAVHETFWADDLVYTSSSGKRFDKATILSNIKKASDTKLETPLIYTAHEVDIRLYGDIAVLAFKLISSSAMKSVKGSNQSYFNTGTLMKRNGRWQAIAWQATKIQKA